MGSFDSEVEYIGADGRKRVRRTGYEGHTLHDLRHTQATLLSGEGVPLRAVQDRLRHAQPTMTNEYTHRIEEKDRAAADKLGELLNLGADDGVRAEGQTGGRVDGMDGKLHG